MIRIIPPKGDFTEKGAGPIGGDFVTRVGECVAEELVVFLACVFDTEIVNNERKIKVITFFVYPEARYIFGLFETRLFQYFLQLFVCKHTGLWEVVHAFSNLHVNPTVVL